MTNLKGCMKKFLVIERLSKNDEEKNCWISLSLGFQVEVKSTFIDALQFVEMKRYPRLRKQSKKLTTLMPTTVCCEQSISVLKHVMYKNMKDETTWAKVMTRMHDRTEQKQI